MVEPPTEPPAEEWQRLMYAFRFCDSFDHLDADTAYLKYGNVEGTFGFTSGPFYGNAARFTGGPNWLDRTPADRDGLDGGREEFVNADCGVFLQLSPPDSWGTTLVEGATVPVPALVPLALVTYDGGYRLQQYLEVRRNGSVAVRTRSGLLGESEPDVFPFPSFGGVRWVHVEYRARFLGDGLDFTEVYLDGVLALNATGASGLEDAEWCTHFRVGNIVEGGDPGVGSGNTGLVDVDDFWYAAPNKPPVGFPDWVEETPGPFGPVGVYRVPLRDDGDASDLIASGGAHFEQVDDPVPDFDGTTVERAADPPPPEPPEVPEPTAVGDLYVPGPWWPPPETLVDGSFGLAGWWTARDPDGVGSSEEELVTMRMLFTSPDRLDGSGFPYVEFRDYNLAAGYRTGLLAIDPPPPLPAHLDDLQVGAGNPQIGAAAAGAAPGGGPAPAPRAVVAHRFRLTQLALELVHTGPLPIPVGGTRSFAFWFTEVP